MTTVLVTVVAEETVAEVRDRLRTLTDHRDEIDSVLVVDGDGRLVDDVSLFELLTAPADARLGELVAPPWPLVVHSKASFAEVVERLIDNRRSSVVVVDAGGCPTGRILADDVIDALVPGRGRVHYPRLLS